MIHPLWRRVWQFLKNLSIRLQLPYNPAIILLSLSFSICRVGMITFLCHGVIVRHMTYMSKQTMSVTVPAPSQALSKCYVLWLLLFPLMIIMILKEIQAVPELQCVVRTPASRMPPTWILNSSFGKSPFLPANYIVFPEMPSHLILVYFPSRARSLVQPFPSRLSPSPPSLCSSSPSAIVVIATDAEMSLHLLSSSLDREGLQLEPLIKKKAQGPRRP